MSAQSQAPALHLAAEGFISELIFDGNISLAAESLSSNRVSPHGVSVCVCVGVSVCMPLGRVGNIFMFCVVSLYFILCHSAHGQNEGHSEKDKQVDSRWTSNEDCEWQVKLMVIGGKGAKTSGSHLF